MKQADWNAGLGPDKEAVVLTPPTIPFWSENLLFTPYDPATGIGCWLHLGTWPPEWDFWEDRVLVTLPGDDGVLTMWAYNKTRSEDKPGASALFFKCIEPFRKWHIRFDGFADHVTTADMTKGGLAPISGPRKRMVIDLDIECVSPVWDAAKGAGDVSKQSWGTDHYEQMCRVHGRIKVDEREWPFDGISWRDHSRGPRGAGTGAAWGGHAIVGGLWPSGKSVMFSRYWTPEGDISLQGGNIAYADGSCFSATVASVPRLRELTLSGERTSASLACEAGPVELAIRCERAIWTSLKNRVAVGSDLTGNGSMYVLHFGEIDWDGETGHFYMERSDLLGLPPIELKTP